MVLCLRQVEWSAKMPQIAPKCGGPLAVKRLRGTPVQGDADCAAKKSKTNKVCAYI